MTAASTSFATKNAIMVAINVVVGVRDVFIGRQGDVHGGREQVPCAQEHGHGRQERDHGAADGVHGVKDCVHGAVENGSGDDHSHSSVAESQVVPVGQLKPEKHAQ